MKIDQTRRDVLRSAAVCAAAAAAVSTPGSLLVLPVSAKEAEKGTRGHGDGSPHA